MSERRPKRAFSEDPTSEDSVKMRRFGSTKSSRVCRHFAKGYCQLGDQCGFSHTAEQPYGDGLGVSGYEQPTFAQQSGLQGQPRAQTPSYDAWNQGPPQQYPTPGQSEYPYSPYGPPPQGPYGARPPTPNVPGVPDVYNPYGTTPTYSGKGIYYDGGEKINETWPPPPTYPGYTAYAPPTSVVGDLSRRKSSTVCRHFAKGYCRLGDTCLFSHTPTNGTTPSSGGGGGGGGGGGSGKIRCRHWARGHCKLESQCRFLHDGEAGKGGTESTTASSSSTSTESL